MIFFFRPKQFNSTLHTEKDFYNTFLKDLDNCKSEVIIESPFITSKRMEYLQPVFQRLLNKGIKIHIITRDPAEHDENFKHQSTNEILKYKEFGINIVLVRGYHHRKLAMIDRQIIWKRSLNILSHSNSQEIVRRIDSEVETKEIFDFLKLKVLI